jgi:hypothetical protein
VQSISAESVLVRTCRGAPLVGRTRPRDDAITALARCRRAPPSMPFKRTTRDRTRGAWQRCAASPWFQQAVRAYQIYLNIRNHTLPCLIPGN